MRMLVEIGPGRGDFLFYLAEKNPDATIVGIEIKRKRIDKLTQQIEQRGLSNVLLIQADARDVMEHLFAPGEVEAISIHFPDPWPKRRHAKHRLLSKTFVIACAHALRIGGEFSFVTDAETYAHDVTRIFKETDCFTPTASSDAFPTYFAQKWIQAGRTIYDQSYFRMSPSCIERKSRSGS